MAQDFAENWTIVEHISNTTTGFSGTLFRCLNDDPARGLKKGELVLSFRSTEFADDAARDNQATNKLEISEKGWAFGQIADMEAWYQTLLSSGKLPSGSHLTVTGYSLGGHLATAFNLLRREDGTSGRIDATYTFNGAGVGTLHSGARLSQVLNTFNGIRQSGAGAVFSTSKAKSLYAQLKGMLGNAPTQQGLAAAREVLAERIKTANLFGGFTQAQVLKEYDWLSQALSRASSVAAENARVEALPNSGPHPAAVALADIEAVRLDYQLGVVIASQNTSAYPSIGLSALADPEAGQYSVLFDRRVVSPTPIANFYDVYGSNRPSAVANSQMHYGTAVAVRVEDQPLHRGNYAAAVAGQSLLNWDVKLIVPNFDASDFGDTHSLVLLVDSLAVQDTIGRLDPAFTAASWGSLMDVASVHRGKTIPSDDIVNAMATALGIPGVPLKGTPHGGTWAESDSESGYSGMADSVVDADGAVVTTTQVQSTYRQVKCVMSNARATQCHA